MCDSEKIEYLKKSIKSYKNDKCEDAYDIFSLMSDQCCFQQLVEVIKSKITASKICVDYVVGVAANGFLFGVNVALLLNLPFVPVRKQGKLPGTCESHTFKQSDGKDCTIQFQTEYIKKGSNVLIVDECLRTGSTLEAVCELLKKMCINPVAAFVIYEEKSKNGRCKVPCGMTVEALIELC